ncbi:MAG TPA: DUF4124 domain-containing protein [Steroidobacteraceae bacterium]|nr:DUF4124 domain-containing protein [Steroidobacteraceae bacterium]
MRRHTAIRLGLLASGFLTAGFAASGARAEDIWKWVDAQGHAQYSDHWTPGAVLIKSDHPRDNDTAPPSDDRAQLNTTNRRIDEDLSREAAQRAVQKDQATAREAQCKQAKDHYQKAIEARRIYREDKSGERTYLTDDEADKARVQARMDVQNACGSAPDSSSPAS